MAISRRQALIGLTGAALFIAQGCAVFRRESELDTALADLEALLGAGGYDNSDRQVEIASEIGELARSLNVAQNEFASEFNVQAIDRNTGDRVLEQLVTDYEQRRLALRQQLLTSQYQLRAEVSSDLWPDVLEVLNRKRNALVPVRARGA